MLAGLSLDLMSLGQTDSNGFVKLIVSLGSLIIMVVLVSPAAELGAGNPFKSRARCLTGDRDLFSTAAQQPPTPSQ